MSVIEGPWQVRHYHLGQAGPLGSFGATIRYKASDTWMDFEFHPGASMVVGSNVVDYAKKGERSFCPTQDLDEAEVCFEGFIKWDGCMQFEFPDGVHVDDWEGAKQIGESILTVRRLAAEVLKSWYGEVQE